VSLRSVSLSVGTRGNRLPSVAGRVVAALYAAVVAGGLGVVLVPMGLSWTWLTALCALVFLARLVAGLHHAVRSVGLLELELEGTPRLLVLRGPWATRRHALDEVTAVQVWCDRGTRLEVLLYNGSSVRVEPGTPLRPDVAALLGELLAPCGIKVVDWGGAGADRH
jgi:hypothetical protein